MPVMKPSMSLVNCTPSSTALASAALATPGAAVGCQMLVHGQTPGTIETAEPAPATSRFPLSSIARTLMLAEPGTPGVQSTFQRVVPCAAFQVAPPSTDTSTPATKPPPWSVEVPVIVTGTPADTVPPLVGNTTADT